MTLQVQAEAASLEILVEAGLVKADSPGQLQPDATLDREIVWRALRASYARGYQDALQDPGPFPLLEASRAEREAWARLPVS